MSYYINLKTNKNPNSNLISSTRIQSPIVPTEEQEENWRKKSVDSFIIGAEVYPMFIELTYYDFVRFVKKCYKKLGKNIELYEPEEKVEYNTYFRIPTKQGAFFEDIDHIQLYNDEYKSNIAVIKIKELCQK